MTAYELRSYPGNAAETTLASGITNAALSIPAVSAAGYSDATGGPAYIIVDYDNSKAEKIRYTSLAGNSFIVPAGGRGQDGTAAVAHSAGAKIRAIWTATDATEANKAAHYTVGLVTTKGDLLAGIGANALGRVATGADNTLLVADSAQAAGVKWSAALTLDATTTLGGVSGTSLAADRSAWTAYTPTFANIAGGAGTFGYKLVGKTLFLRASFSAGTGTSPWTMTLPAALTAAADQRVAVGYGSGGTAGSISSGGTTISVPVSGNLATVGFSAVIEVA